MRCRCTLMLTSCIIVESARSCASKPEARNQNPETIASRRSALCRTCDIIDFTLNLCKGTTFKQKKKDYVPFFCCEAPTLHWSEGFFRVLALDCFSVFYLRPGPPLRVEPPPPLRLPKPLLLPPRLPELMPPPRLPPPKLPLLLPPLPPL